MKLGQSGISFLFITFAPHQMPHTNQICWEVVNASHLINRINRDSISERPSHRRFTKKQKFKSWRARGSQSINNNNQTQIAIENIQLLVNAIAFVNSRQLQNAQMNHTMKFKCQ